MNKVQKTGDAKKGGLLVGDSHADGGMPAIVVDTGQPIEVEGGEVIINKEASKKYWKELSKINQSAGNGVPIPPPADFSGDVSQYDRGGKISLSDLKVGTQMELEHSNTIKKYMKSGMTVEQVARSIAKDHLNENPNYYKILKKLKLAKGGEIVCRSCGNSWLQHQKDVGMNVFECESCGSQNFKFYKGGVTPDMSKKEIKEFYDSPEGKKLDAETFKEWDTLVNMSKSEIEKFYNSEEGKKAGLTQEKANELGIDNGRTSARWIMKMKGIDYRNWTSEMWIWAKRQISFIKRMSGNKGSLYHENGNKTRKHTSLLIWGHNPEKFNGGGRVDDEEQRKEIVKILQSFGLTRSKSKTQLKEVSFDRFEKVRSVLQEGYTLSKDSKHIEIDYNEYSLRQKYGGKNYKKILEYKVEFIKKISQELKNNGFELYDYGYSSNYEISIIGKKNSFNKGGRTNGGGLLAPNGSPSNLTPEQYKLVRTPEFKTGGRIAITQAQFNERIFRAYKNIKYVDGKILIEGKQIGTIAGGKVTSTKSRFYAHSIFPNVDSVSATTRKSAVEGLIQNTVEKGFLYNPADEFKTGGKLESVKVYHGSTRKFDEFDNSKLGEATKSSSANLGFWFTDDISTAKSYPRAENWNKVQDFIDSGDIKSAQKLEAEISKNQDTKYLKNIVLNYSNPLTIDADGAMYNDFSEEIIDAIKQAQQNNNDVLIIKRLSDNADYSEYTPATHYLVLDNSIIENVSDIRFEEGGSTDDKQKIDILSIDYSLLTENEFENLAFKVKSRNSWDDYLAFYRFYNLENFYFNKICKNCFKSVDFIELFKQYPIVADAKIGRIDDISNFISEEIKDKFTLNFIGGIDIEYNRQFYDTSKNWVILDKYTVDIYFKNIKFLTFKVSTLNFDEFKREYIKALNPPTFDSNNPDIRFAKGGRAKTNEGGDCYLTAGNIALDLAKGLNSHEFIGTPYVVHAEVAGQGAISGMRYGHAWVEDDVFVYDFSNGRSIIFPKQLYYQLGQVIQKKPKYYKYTFKEARAKMIESGHYGSWDLKTESGL